MKFSLIILFLALAALAQSRETPSGIPPGAVAIEDNTWRWVDKGGKSWLFRATPFGLMRSEEPKQVAAKRPAAAPAGLQVADSRPDPTLDLISVKEEGGALRFSRPGPFGQYSWVKKKTELDKDETIVWQRARARSGATSEKSGAAKAK